MSWWQSPFAISELLVGLSSLGFGLFVLLKAPKRRSNQLWCLFTLAVAIWGFGGVWIVPEQDPSIALLKWKIVVAVGVTWTAILHFHFVCHFLEIRRSKALLASYVFGVLSTGLCLATPWIYSGTRYLWNEMHWSLAGPLHPLFLLCWTALIVYSHWELWLHYREVSGTRKLQIRWFFLASAIGYTSAVLEYLPTYGIDLYPWSNFGIVLYPFIMTYAILQYRLFDISVMIRRSLLVSILAGLFVAGYFGLIYAAERLFQMSLLQHHILALSLTAITTFGLGLLVFVAGPKRALNRAFALYTVSLAWWSVSECFEVSAPGISSVNIWNLSKFLGACFIAPAFLHTVVFLTDDRRRTTRVMLTLGYVIGAVFVLLRLLTDVVTKEPHPVAYTNYYTPLTPVGYCLAAVFFVLVTIGLLRLWKTYRASCGQKRTQLKYLFWGSFVGYVGGSPDWAFAFGFHIPILSPFGIYGVPLYSMAITYAVLQHRLFDFNLVIRKSLVYSLLVTLLTVSYFGLVYTVEQLLQTTFGYQSPWLSLAAFALMALAFQPLKIGIQRLVDWLLFRAPHEELVRRMERLEHEVRQADKLKAVSTLAAGLAHEIKNPLTAIKTFTEFLPEHYHDADFREKFTRIVTKEVNKIIQIVHHLLEFAKPAPPKLQPVQLAELLDETLDFLSNDCLKRLVSVERTYSPNGTIQADPQQLRQVFLNLILNSLEAMDGQEGGTLAVSTTTQNGHLTLTIADTGPGIPKEDLHRLGEPFFTTKENGTGLGLSIVHSIITEHRGTIHFDSAPNRGTTCRLTFPLIPQGLYS